MTNLKNTLGLRNNIDQFSTFEGANRWANNCVKLHIVMLGDNGQYNGQWATEPELGRVAYGIPDRLDRLKGLGNAIVPQVAFEIFKAIDKLNK